MRQSHSSVSQKDTGNRGTKSRAGTTTGDFTVMKAESNDVQGRKIVERGSEK